MNFFFLYTIVTNLSLGLDNAVDCPALFILRGRPKSRMEAATVLLVLLFILFNETSMLASVQAFFN